MNLKNLDVDLGNVLQCRLKISKSVHTGSFIYMYFNFSIYMVQLSFDGL